MSLNDTPRGSRLHIGIYGRRNSGKSSLINALTGQDIALVSDSPGTTTDPVYKSMELHPIGPVVFIDTAGFDDEGELGKLRVERTQEVVNRTDVAIVVIDGAGLARQREEGGEAENTGTGSGLQGAEGFLDYEKQWIEALTAKDVPVIIAVNKLDEFAAEIAAEDCDGRTGAPAFSQPRSCADGCSVAELFLAGVEDALGRYPVVAVSAAGKLGFGRLRRALENAVPEDFLREKILGDMIAEGGLALLVMPQDIQAPKGRLILPQVQTLRELLDRGCTAVTTTADGLEKALAALSKAPDLIITDSQCFHTVYEKKPMGSELTSFSVLFAAYKGDIDVFVKGASAIDALTEKSKVLIAEACTHVPLSEDIGREKIPALLRRKFGSQIEIVNVCGSDFPDEKALCEFDLIIHCGACMFNRKHVMNRIAAAEGAGVPVTNYGVALAKLAGILDKIKIPR